MSDNLLEQLNSLLKHKKSKTYYAAKLGVSEEEVEELLKELKNTNYLHVVGTPTPEYTTTYSSEPRLISEKVFENGTKQLEISSDRPLTKEEIEDKYGIDGITSRLSNYWNKELPSGKYIVSAFVKCLINDFYTENELKDKLAEIFPKISKITLPKVKNTTEECLNILIADDHCGMVNETNIFGAEPYNKNTYLGRLHQLIGKIVNLGKVFEEVNIISLGDQLNGHNSQTTRGGHEVKSLPNKEQFDIYVQARKSFYDALFASGVGNKYTVREVDNSNHSGLGFSYMANSCLAMYLQTAYPEVEFFSIQEAIAGFSYGVHTIIFGHGKDEKFQKRPFPYNLDVKTDLFLYEWLNNKGVNPQSTPVTFYKGDLHSYGINNGKFGRYINIPSIAGNSDYGDINFGNTQAGAVLEIFDKNTNTISTQPIWF